MGFGIRTERLLMEDMTAEDLPNVRRIARDRDVMRYVLIWLENDEQIAAFHQRAVDESQSAGRMEYMFAVRIPGTGEFAGISFLEIDPLLKSTAEAGYILLPDYWNAGYATEILRALLRFGFCDRSLHRVYGKCDELNAASARVMEKCGMVYEGTLREHVWLRDHWRSTHYYGMLDAEYAARLP